MHGCDWILVSFCNSGSGSVISTGSNSQQQLLSTSQHRLLRKSSQLLHNSTAKLTPITETSDTTPTTKKKHETNFKVLQKLLTAVLECFDCYIRLV